MHMYVYVYKRFFILAPVDINECATSNGGCEVYCTDTQGSFTCSCQGHEILDSTGLFCIGK